MEKSKKVKEKAAKLQAKLREKKLKDDPNSMAAIANNHLLKHDPMELINKLAEMPERESEDEEDFLAPLEELPDDIDDGHEFNNGEESKK